MRGFNPANRHSIYLDSFIHRQGIKIVKLSSKSQSFIGGPSINALPLTSRTIDLLQMTGAPEASATLSACQ